jgi:hypothetical protein
MRRELAPYLNQRIYLTGEFGCIPAERPDIVVFQRVWLGETYIGHLWVRDAGGLEWMELRRGDLVGWSSVVRRYYKGRRRRQWDYSTSHPTGVVLLSRSSLRSNGRFPFRHPTDPPFLAV